MVLLTTPALFTRNGWLEEVATSKVYVFPRTSVSEGLFAPLMLKANWPPGVVTVKSAASAAGRAQDRAMTTHTLVQRVKVRVHHAEFTIHRRKKGAISRNV